MKLWALLFALMLAACGVQAATPVGALLVQNDLSEIAAAGPAAQLAARNNLGISSVGTLTTITDGTNSFPVATTLQFTGAAVSSSAGKVIVTITAAATTIAGGTTGVTGITSGDLLYNNAGKLGDFAGGTGVLAALAANVSGSGSIVLNSGPSITSLTVLTGFTATGLVTNADLVNAATTVNGQTCTLGSTCTVAAAAGTLTGTALNAAITTAAGLTTVAGGALGTAAFVNTGSSGGAVGLLNAAWTLSGASYTFPNAALRVFGTGAGYNALTSNNSGATNYSNALPNASGPLTYQLSSVTNTHIATWCGAGCLQDGGVPGGNISFSDGLGDGPFTASAATLYGGILAQPSAGVVTYTPSTPTRVVTSSGGTCGSIGATTAAVCASDAGGIIYVEAPSLTIAISALGSSYLPAGQNVTICYRYASGSVAISSANQILGFTTTGSGPYVATINAPQNGAQSCLPLQSDGTYLKQVLATPQNIAFLNVADQTLTGGFIKTPYAIGTITSGTVTVDCGTAETQTLTNNGAFTLAMGTNKGTCTLNITNGASAGTITASGFTVGNDTGASTLAAIPTTNTAQFDVDLIRISSLARYTVHTYQVSSATFGLVAASTPWSAAATATSGATNMTGAGVLFFAATWNATSTPTVTPSDSSSNTWTALASCTVGGNAVTKIWYTTTPTVGATQTFTITSTANSLFNAQVVGFSVPAGFAIDGSQVCNNAGNAPTVQAGSITPAGAGDLFFFVGNSTDTGAAMSIATPFNATAAVASAGSGYLGLLVGYYINAGSTAQNPIETISGGTQEASAAMVAFKP